MLLITPWIRNTCAPCGKNINWKRRQRRSNKTKKPLPPLPPGTKGDPHFYYRDFHHIDLFNKRIRNGYDCSSLPNFTGFT